ncbi:MAG: DUF2062 domain-containing protein [Candidatus Hydrogenedentota bacterium]
MFRAYRYYYLRVMRQRGTPEQIAAGVAIGAFMGLAGPPGLQMLTAFALAALFGCNRVAAVLAVWICNPLTMPFIYGAQLTNGSWITGIPVRDVVPTSPEQFWAFITNIHAHGRAVLVMFVGMLVTGIITSLALYYPVRSALIAFRQRKEERRQRKRLEAQGLLNPVIPQPRIVQEDAPPKHKRFRRKQRKTPTEKPG